MKDDPDLEYHFKEAREQLLVSLGSVMNHEEIEILSEFNAMIFTNKVQRRILFDQL